MVRAFEFPSARIKIQNTFDAGLHSLSLCDEPNLEEWIVAHLGNWSHSYCTALYDMLGAQAVQYIVWHAELSVIYVEKDKLPALVEALTLLPDDMQRYINQHEAVADEDVAKELGVELLAFSALLAKGGDGDSTEAVEKPDDLAWASRLSWLTGRRYDGNVRRASSHDIRQGEAQGGSGGRRKVVGVRQGECGEQGGDPQGPV